MAKLESKFQADLIRELKQKYEGCLICKMDSSYIQGIPDLLILYKNHWALLECKRDEKATHRPNQDYYVDRLNSMSFAAFIYPENKEEVLEQLEVIFNGLETTQELGR